MLRKTPCICITCNNARAIEAAKTTQVVPEVAKTVSVECLEPRLLGPRTAQDASQGRFRGQGADDNYGGVVEPANAKNEVPTVETV